ncbi:MAG: O-succinylbenzoic acid--CoA ligase [uncultured Acidimicrobiales bacterium]|uniref:O-succinylbenzoic acid--CoA ligase n=1 Tax=uncultured Acidimicrobiales bacterium TaxID=310071 RepID=A0A6J4I764_9ACTN|nr:MAG: O-succinylbenzoic acid--CoA ligase [uncultured Acidimicrobiales bacterium]
MPDLVAIAAPGGPLFVRELSAAWERGDAVLPVDPRLPLPAARRLLAALRPSVLVDEAGDRQSLLDAAPTEVGDALVVASSGTTGEPKGVVLTMDAVRASALATSARLDVDPARDTWLACLPLSHVGGLSVLTRALLTDTPVEVLPAFDPATRATLVSVVRTLLTRHDLTRFRRVVLGGSAPPDALPDNVVTTYGMTETGSGVVYDGRPLDGVDVHVEPDGEIRVRGPMLLRAYRDGSDPKDADGWLSTGDLGFWTDDGRLQVHGRRGDLIITGGENVWPEPVEAALRSHRGIADVGVAGAPDPEWGSRVVAYVVPRDPASPPTLDAVRAHVKQELPAFCAPRELVLCETLPRTALGKLRRGELFTPR